VPDLTERRFLVTGAGAGIGAGICRRLAADGARVAVTDLDLGAAEAVAAGLGGGAVPLRLDVTSGDEIAAACDRLVAGWGGLDGVVNNAGIGAAGTVETADLEDLDRILDVNLRGPFLVIRHTLALLRESASASIVNIGSIAAQVGLRERAAVSASKGGLEALTRAVAVDLAGAGIRVNSVAPGAVETPWIGRMVAQSEDPARAREEIDSRQPLGRLVAIEEVAAAVAYLLGDDSAAVTGTCLVVDGGVVAQ
jgi:NAD(P)-dependent dehydrogenase (short-subunit alcohol dehydrogenase family)